MLFRSPKGSYVHSNVPVKDVSKSTKDDVIVIDSDDTPSETPCDHISPSVESDKVLFYFDFICHLFLYVCLFYFFLILFVLFHFVYSETE